MAASLISEKTLVRVSSVLNRDIGQFGKKHIFDGEEDTCWNSDQGSPQWIFLEFPQPVCIQEIQMRFQGGFVGKDCWIEGGVSINNLKRIANLYPEDDHSLQIFKIETQHSWIKILKVVFNSSTDFFGRITLYKMNLLGSFE